MSEDPAAWQPDPSSGLPVLDHLTEAELARLARSAVDALARRSTVAGFQSLVDLSGYVGAALGESARRVAEQGSWSQVAEITGTSKQAAWSRWH